MTYLKYTTMDTKQKQFDLKEVTINFTRRLNSKGRVWFEVYAIETKSPLRHPADTKEEAVEVFSTWLLNSLAQMENHAAKTIQIKCSWC